MKGNLVSSMLKNGRPLKGYAHLIAGQDSLWTMFNKSRSSRRGLRCGLGEVGQRREGQEKVGAGVCTRRVMG